MITSVMVEDMYSYRQNAEMWYITLEKEWEQPVIRIMSYVLVLRYVLDKNYWLLNYHR